MMIASNVLCILVFCLFLDSVFSTHTHTHTQTNGTNIHYFVVFKCEKKESRKKKRKQIYPQQFPFSYTSQNVNLIWINPVSPFFFSLQVSLLLPLHSIPGGFYTYPKKTNPSNTILPQLPFLLFFLFPFSFSFPFFIFHFSFSFFISTKSRSYTFTSTLDHHHITLSLFQFHLSDLTRFLLV